MRFNWWLRFVYYNGPWLSHHFLQFKKYSFSMRKIKRERKRKSQFKSHALIVIVTHVPPHTRFQYIYSIYNFVEFCSRFNKPSDEEISINQISVLLFLHSAFLSAFPFASSIKFHGHSLNIYYLFSINWCLVFESYFMHSAII